MKPFFFTLGILLLMSGFELCAQALVINEFMSKNQTVLTDFEGDTPDWIELYNPNSESLSLTGFKLSDNADFTETTGPSPLI